MKLRRSLETMLVLGALGLQIASGSKPEIGCSANADRIINQLNFQQQEANKRQISDGIVILDFPFKKTVDWDYIQCVVDDVENRRRR